MQSHPRTSSLTRAITAAVLAVACGPLLAATGGAHAEAKARYDREMAACRSGQTTQDRSACMDEARSAYAEARRGVLGDRMEIDTSAAMKRCEALEGDERTACVSRMNGQGTTSGSVGAGHPVAGEGLSSACAVRNPGRIAAPEPEMPAVDLKVPITITDELSEEVISSTGQLNLASGEIQRVEYQDYDFETRGLPFESEDYEFTSGTLSNDGKDVEFRIDVNTVTGQYSVSASELLEIKVRAAALFAGVTGKALLANADAKTRPAAGVEPPAPRRGGGGRYH